ncbi:hypothetical protein NECAME_10943 [Necator americanus]|uniref:Uncharacterized protein n=1 Tax=Necator americanus TaxID=51031 RepID=W2T7I5_NECAM|nr:hypothetical protein NECAME_10943 [Necator americanus]ETN77594.1 hypothetical protein NECAME_10943 [Necator americanus]
MPCECTATMERIKMLQKNPLVAIACGQFALSLMQAMFMFYYVRIYLNVFQVPQQWFNIAQTLFLFWNAINDPLFGYMQDKPGSWLNSRPRVIRTFSPFLAIAFVFMWVPWSKNSAFEGIHLIVSLFFYDAFYSAIGVAWSALFADSTKEPRLRVSAMKYSQISILASVNIIAITEKLSHSLELRNSRYFGFIVGYRGVRAKIKMLWVFQIIAVFVAAIALYCFMVTGSVAPSLPFTDENGSLLVDTWETSADHLAKNGSVSHMNFASTATELLIPETILPKGSLRLSLFYGVLTLGPQEYISTKQSSTDLVNGMRILLISTPLVLGAFQYFIFKSYSLTNKHICKVEEDI